MKKPAEEGPRRQCESLLVEGPKHDDLGPVLHRELLATAALSSRDLFLQEDAMLHHVLDVRLL
jgi:hypothetical protein